MIIAEDEIIILGGTKMNLKRIFSAVTSAAMIFSSAAAFADMKHPGALHTAEDFTRIKTALNQGKEPYKSAFEVLKASEYAKPAGSSATETINRGGNGDNVARLYRDVARAYQCALRWKIEGNAECGEGAKDILNAWSSTLKNVGGNADRYLASGLYGYEMANASEIMRDYPGFDVKAMQDMLVNVFYKPLNERFLYANEFGRDHNDAHIQNYWANWDLANVAASVAIGIFCDREDIFDRAIEYYKYGAGNGSIYNFIPYCYPGSLAQWQESGRDQGHANLGVGLAACICEMAWNQGIDLYGFANNRFMYAAEYVARYNNGFEVPFRTYEWRNGQKGDLQSQPGISGATRGEMRPIWEMIYNHYTNRMGLSVPNVQTRAEQARPEGGPGGHGSTFDQLGFGTLMYTREPSDPKTMAVVPEGNIAEGVYRIICRRTGKALAPSDGEVAQFTVDTENSEQLWEIAHVGGGQYTITNVSNGLQLAVENESYDNLAKIVTEKYQCRNSQKFAFLNVDDGIYRIVAAHASKSLDVLNMSNDDGASIIQFRYDVNNNQQWKLELVEAKDTVVPAVADMYKVYVTFNGEYIESDAEPVLENGRTLVPVRAIFEALGGEMTWNGSTQTVMGKKGDDEIVLKIGDSQARVNGEPYTLDVPAKIINNRTFVPLRFISENLRANVTWNEAARTAEIQD